MPKPEPSDQIKRIDCDLVEAKMFVLKDDDGKQRASFSCRAANDQDEGYTAIHLYDKNGAPKISLQVGDKGSPNITLFNTQNNSPAIGFSSSGDRGNGITITSVEGTPLLNICVHGSHSHEKVSTTEISASDEQRNRTWSVINGEMIVDENGAKHESKPID